MRVHLDVTAGPHAGSSFRFDGHATFLVGRSPRAHFALPEKDPYVSRFHFIIEVNPPLIRLRDMGSRNGTLVNERPIGVDADLRSGDAIRIGETTIIVRTTAVGEGAASPDSTFESYSPAPVPVTAEGQAPGPWVTIPGYDIRGVLGSGGMGVVYRAVQITTGHPVALKTIKPEVRPSAIGLERFRREAEISRQLDHPHIVRYLDTGGGEDGRALWFAMEFVQGEDASRIVQREGRVRPGRAVGWAVQLLDALGHAHARKFVHRDVKPANLIVAIVGGSEIVKLADFGLARAYEGSAMSGLTLTGARGGTAQFMPPEQILDMKNTKPPADIYATAATLYRLLTGASPYPAQPTVQAMFLQILQDEPTPIAKHIPNLPPRLADAIHRGLARDPGHRFPSAEAFADAIRPFAGSPTTVSE